MKELHFFPAFLSFRYNILNFDDTIFIRTGYGRLLNMGKNFEKGTLFFHGYECGYNILRAILKYSNG